VGADPALPGIGTTLSCAPCTTLRAAGQSKAAAAPGALSEDAAQAREDKDRQRQEMMV
jgi:hypothetical protein